MNFARKLLLTTAGLAVIFGAGVSGGFAAAPQQHPPAVTDTVQRTESAPTAATIVSAYNTSASRRLQSLEREFNRNRPAGSPEVVYADYDQIATWYSMREAPDRLEQAIGQYLTAKTGQVYAPQLLSQLAQAMDRLQPAEFAPVSGGGACVVVPPYPGISFESFYAATFRVGAQDPLAGKTVTINLSTQEFGDYATAHETWHCFDTRYRLQTGTGLDGAVKDNRTEMFADLGGVMENIRAGGNLTIIDKVAAERSAWIYLTGPIRAQLPQNDAEHYKSIIYNTQPGLYALKARIQEMGIDNFRHLSRGEMRDLAYRIVDASALTPQQARGLEQFYATGKAPASVAAQVQQLRAAAAASVRDATPAELAAQHAAPGTTESALVAALRRRAGEMGDASSLVNQLKARQEMTDRLRAKLSGGATQRGATEAQLNLLFRADPHLGGP